MPITQLNQTITKKNLLSYALPTIIGLLFTSAYTIIDGMFVANFIHTHALAAINIVFPLIMFVVAIAMMMATGGSAVIARKLGKNALGEARSIFSFLVMILSLFSLLLCAINLGFLEPLLQLLGANAVIYPYAHTYAVWTFLSVPFAMVGVFFQILFITAGKTKLALISTIIGGVINIILDYVLIVLFDLGISGAAIATGLGYCVPFIVGLYYFGQARSTQLHFIKPKWHWRELWETCANGASEMVVNLSQAVVTILLNITMMRLAGEVGIAAITIILYGQTFLTAAFMGYATGIAPIISFNFGKKNQKRIAQIFRFSHHLIFFTALVAASFGMIFAEPLVHLFSEPTSAIFALSVTGFRYSALAFLFMGFNIFGSAFFTALSNGKTSAFIALMRTFIFQVMMIVFCATFFGLDGVFFALPLAEVAGLLVTYSCFKKHHPTLRLI